MPIKVERSALLERTRELLRNRPKGTTLELIAGNTGLTIAFLTYLASERQDGFVPDPSVNRIVALYEYLSQSKLELR